MRSYRYFDNWYCSLFWRRKSPGGKLPYVCPIGIGLKQERMSSLLPYRHWSETRENEFSLVWNSVRIWRAGRHNPTANSQEYPPFPGVKIESFLSTGPVFGSLVNKSWSWFALKRFCAHSTLCGPTKCPHRMLGRVYPDFGRVSASLSSVITKRKLTQTWPLYLRRLKLFGAKFLMSGHGIRI